MYDTGLIKGNVFLAIEMGAAITLLIEVASIAIALAYVAQMTRGLKRRIDNTRMFPQNWNRSY